MQSEFINLISFNYDIYYVAYYVIGCKQSFDTVLIIILEINMASKYNSMVESQPHYQSK